MLTELPIMLTLLDQNYQLDYCLSYTGTLYMVNIISSIDGYKFCIGLKRAFVILISQ